ncbi:hypothetical protein TNCV_1337001 [Trichonephila clavipes]|nr:hypothetical protein TNCV_1337001 [Trichonephila clavipes]
MRKKNKKRCFLQRKSFSVRGMVSTDGQQRSAPSRHGVNEAINHELVYSVPLFQKSSFQILESLWGWLAASNSSS